MKRVLYFLMGLLISFSAVAQADIQPGPQAVVENTTKRVMDIIAEGKGYFDQDPDRFYDEVQTVLGEVVDFNSFARGVMGKYASKKRYQSLSKEEKGKLRAQVMRFSQVFQDGLVQTYAKGLLAFNGNRIEVLPLKDEANDQKGAAIVEQHIYGNSEKPYVVFYKLRQDRSGAWKLRNVTIEAVNLGKIYQSQFYSAVKQYNGDIDKVIDNWTVDPNVGSEQQAAKAG